MCAYPDNHVKVLSGSDATRKNIEKELDNLKKLIYDLDDGDKCTVVVFFSGHGALHEGKSYLVPYECKSEANLATQAIDGEFVYDKLQLIKAGNVFLFVNAWYPKDVELPGGEGTYNLVIGVEPLVKKQIKYLGQNFFALSAAQSAKKAYELQSLKSSKSYSPFAIALCNAFSGQGSGVTDSFVRFNDVLKTLTEYLGLEEALSTGHKDGNPEVGYRTEVGSRTLVDDFKRKEVGSDVKDDSDMKEKERMMDELEVGTRTSTTTTYGNITITSQRGPVLLGNTFGNNTRF
jgi:hypothetical protein